MENKNLTSVPLEVTVREAAPIFYTRFLDLRILVLRKWAHILITDLQHMLRLGRHCLSSKRCWHLAGITTEFSKDHSTHCFRVMGHMLRPVNSLNMSHNSFVVKQVLCGILWYTVIMCKAFFKSTQWWFFSSIVGKEEKFISTLSAYFSKNQVPTGSGPM